MTHNRFCRLILTRLMELKETGHQDWKLGYTSLYIYLNNI